MNVLPRLENGLLSVELDPATGGFLSIVDKRAGREYIGGRRRPGLFRLMAPLGDEACRHIDSADAAIQVDGAGATIRYENRDARAAATLTLAGDTIEARLVITNLSGAPIEEVLFPLLRDLAPRDDACFVWPWWGTRRYTDLFTKALGGDHHTWNEGGQKIIARYPAHLATAWCDYGTGEGGIGLEALHRDFSIVDFCAHKVVDKTTSPVRRTLDIYTSHPRRVRPGETYTTPTMRIHVHPGDWHAVADKHRAWLETWVGKPDRPARMAEAIGWHFYFMKHQDGHVAATYADLPDMARAALEAGCPYILLFGWQVGGHDNHYFYGYHPNPDWGGEEALRTAVSRCRDLGVEVMPFYNGTLANTEAPEHKEFGHRWVARTRTGHPYYAGDWCRHNFDAPSRNRSMLHHEISPCAPMRDYFLGSMKRIIQDYGFGNTQLDQIAEKMLVDYDESHIESTADRVYVDGLAALLPAVRRLIREVNPEGVMISECLNDFTGQWCDSSWDWTLLYEFPEPILYTLPWLMGSLEIDALEYAEANRAFVYKLHLDMKIDGGDSPITKYPDFAAHIRSHAQLRRRVAPYYVYGDFRDQEGITVAGPAGVLARVYHNRAESKAAIVVAETAGQATAADITSAWKCGSTSQCVSSDGTSSALEGSDRLSVRLAPLEVKVLCLDLR